MSVTLTPRGPRRLVGRKRLVVLLNLGPMPCTSVGALRGSTPARCHGALLKHLGIPTTRESHFHMFQNTVTLAKTPN